MKYNVHMLKNFSVLVAEDDIDVLNDMTQMLLVFFKEVLQASNGEEALRIYEAKKPNIILSDIQMPKSDGLWLVNKIRSVDPAIPILFISSYSDKPILLNALNSGVDGYILKPFELEEVLQAITNSLRRSEMPGENRVCFKNGLIYNTATKELTGNGLCIDLGVKEHALLSLFLQNQTRTLTKIEILDKVWSLDEITDSAFKSVLNRLRKKIGGESIVNVKNIGWRLSLES